MPLTAPNLDDRRFEDLVREAKARIPRYVPEWTDHNQSDPGITLLELFAWLSEMLLYRLNRVPERNYVEFLRMIGVELQPARPASSLVTLVMPSPPMRNAVVVPAGVRVAASPPPPAPSAADLPQLPAEADSEPIVFETQSPLVVFRNALEQVMSFDGVGYTDVTLDNAPDAQPFLPFGPAPSVGAALLLGFNADTPLPTDELSLQVVVHDPPDAARTTECDWAGLCAGVPASVEWEYYTAAGWAGLDVLRDETRGVTVSGRLLFRGPANAGPLILGSGPTAKPRFWLRTRLLSADYDVAPKLDAVLTNTVRALAVQTIRDESVGGSNGEPNQVFRLRQAPVYAEPPGLPPKGEREPGEAERAAFDATRRRAEITRGFLLEVDEGSGPSPWLEVPDFFTSTPDSRHYTLNRATGEIRFGNGEHGRIPLASVNNIVARYYRWGGGAAGNAAAGNIKDLQTNVDGIESATNPYAAEGGADAESLDAAKLRSARELKARDRAVTAEDFEVLALETPGVRIGRAYALPLRHPDFPGIDVPGAVTLVVLPANEKDRPTPSESTRQAVCAYLDVRRLLTVQLFVAPPSYTRVRIEAEVTVGPTADAAAVKKNAEAALKAFLHPLHGGPQGTGWPVGGTVFRSDIFRVLLGAGAETVGRVTIYVDGTAAAGCDDATIPADHIAYSVDHQVSVTFAATNGQGRRC